MRYKNVNFIIIIIIIILYILELAIGFETNIQINSNRKVAKYSSLISDLSPYYSKVIFINSIILLKKES